MGVKVDPKLKEILLPHQHSPRAPATWAQGVKYGTLWSTKPGLAHGARHSGGCTGAQVVTGRGR